MLTIELNQDEKIVKIVRKHWIAIIGHIVSFICMLLLPLLLFFAIVFITNITFQEISIFLPILLFAYSIWLLFGWAFLFYAWTNYYLDVMITTLRIFVIDQKELFSRQISSFTFDKIHDLTIDINGILATFLKFGKVTLETAAERKIFMFPTARDPEMVKKAINDAQNDYQALY